MRIKDVIWFWLETKTPIRVSARTKRKMSTLTTVMIALALVEFFILVKIHNANKAFRITNKELVNRITIVRENNKALRENNLHLVYINKRLVDINYDITSTELGILIDIRDGGLDEEAITSYAARFDNYNKSTEEEDKKMQDLVAKEENIKIDHPLPKLDNDDKIIVNAPIDNKGNLIPLDKDAPVPKQADQPDVEEVIKGINDTPHHDKPDKQEKTEQKKKVIKYKFGNVGAKDDNKYARNDWNPQDQWYGAGDGTLQ